MTRLTHAFIAALAAILLTGCSTTAPQYAAALDNVELIKKAPAPARVGAFSASPDKANANPISLRGNPMNSPYNSSYADYVAEALKQELTLAGKFAPGADIEISGTLLKNDIDTSGFSTGTGNIEARFIVRNKQAVKYDKVKTANTQWESSFVGGIAIPRAIAQYPVLVNKLLGLLYADPDFINALK